MEDLVAIMRKPMIFNSPPTRHINKPNNQGVLHAAFLPSSADMADLRDVDMGFSSLAELKTTCYNKRLPSGLGERLRHIACAFRQVLASIGLPYNFTAFCPPIHIQRDGWTYGYIAMTCVFLNLQTLVGASRADLTRSHRPSISFIEIGTAQSSDTDQTEFSLPQQDWMFAPIRSNGRYSLEDLDKGNDRMKQFFAMLALEEISVKNLLIRDGKDFSNYLGNLGTIQHRRVNLAHPPIGAALNCTQHGRFQVIDWPGFSIANHWNKQQVVTEFGEYRTYRNPQPVDNTLEVRDQRIPKQDLNIVTRSLSPGKPRYPRRLTPPETLVPETPSNKRKASSSQTAKTPSKSPKKKAEEAAKRASYRTASLSVRPLIDNSIGEELTAAELARQRRKFFRPSGEFGVAETTTELFRTLNLTRVPNRPTQAINRTRTHTTFVPNGLVSNTQWPRIAATLNQHFYPPTQSISQAKHYARRDQRRIEAIKRSACAVALAPVPPREESSPTPGPAPQSRSSSRPSSGHSSPARLNNSPIPLNLGPQPKSPSPTPIEDQIDSPPAAQDEPPAPGDPAPPPPQPPRLLGSPFQPRATPAVTTPLVAQGTGVRHQDSALRSIASEQPKSPTPVATQPDTPTANSKNGEADESDKSDKGDKSDESEEDNNNDGDN
ncbi:hypothetical protein B0T10DRAFT_545392 [Thelonectria olida]|uniref:Uncharacterized protein n=1 Tax=Thelonectria olida TaxID=1576542 RepID=A0A9P8WFY8_9HYPO|nr:hypothetical protein B0T10DRAFT_545392 [Thelonectria olida]